MPAGRPPTWRRSSFSGGPATIASEIYAIGVLLFHILTGNTPSPARIRRAARGPCLRHASDRARRAARPARGAGPCRRNGDPPGPAETFRQHRADDCRAVRCDRDGVAASALHHRAPAGAFFAPGCWRRCCRAVALLVAFLAADGAQRRRLSRAPLAGAQEDYRRAHDLLAHYYRPQALETAIPLLEKIVAQDPRFAPAFADLGRANLLQFIQQRDTKYIEPARESVAACPRAGARPGVGARDAWRAVRCARRRTTSRATNWRRRCGSTSSTRRRTVRWRTCTSVKAARNWWNPPCRKPSAWRPTIGAWCSNSASTI